jgi:hypothetical protein
MKKLLLASLLLSVLFFDSCKKDNDDNNITGTSLMDGAVEYTGAYPASDVVTFTEGGTTSAVEAFPGQVIVFFELPVTDADASKIITDLGGTVAGKIPAVGYYFATVAATSTTSFITSLNDNAKVSYAVPNNIGYLSGGVNVIDGCNSGSAYAESHAAKVQANVTGCGGAVQVCENFIANSNNEVSKDKILHAIIKAVQNNSGGDILINISAAAGFRDGSYFNWGAGSQEEAQKAWYYFTRDILKIVSSLEPKYRKRLVVTIATGNGNMPITDLLNMLRNTPDYASALANNVLFVSNKADSINGPSGKGNYSRTDPDVIVTDNADAAQGTSFAAPCAMGLIQKVMQTKGVGAVEAMKAIKMVSLTDYDRKVNDSYLNDIYQVVDLIKSKTEYKADKQAISFGPEETISGPLVCYQKFYFISSPSIFWNGSEGSMIMPCNYKREFVPPSSAGCTMSGVTESNNTIIADLSGNNNNITGSGSAYFASGGGEWLVEMEFNGAVNIYGDITGTLITTFVPMPPSLAPITTTVTFFKQE